MARYLSVIALLAGLAAAVREETHQEAFLEEGLDQEMKLVPAKISKAIRRAGRHAQEAMQAAEEKKANMTQAKASATQKASEASELQAASSKAMEEAAVKRDEAQKKKTEAEQAVREEGKADQALTAALQDVADKEADLTSKEAQYREFMKEVNKKIQDLVNDKIKANEALDKLREKLETKKDKAEALTAEKAAKGAISEKATEHKEAAEAEMQEAVDKANKAQEVAEKAQNDFIIAKAEADQAEQMHSQAVKELEKKTDLHQMVENVRNKTDDFYKALDKMTLSMEATLRQQKESGADGAKPAHELVREDPNVKASMEGYNEMVIAFRRLHSFNKEFYDFMAGSIQEIHENANAAYALQCDPTEELEMEGKEIYQQKCGRGMWKDLKLERFSFPHKHTDVNHKAQLPSL